MLKGIVLLGCVSLLFTSISYATESDYSRQYSICMNRSGGVTSNMLNCNGAEINRQDERLNNAYKQAMKSLDVARKKQLQDVQRLWIRYRDANCDFYADPNGGTIASLNSSSCYLKATASRATELEGLLAEY